MKLERTKNTARNFFWGFLNKAVTLLLPFIIRTLIIRVLGKEYLGLNNLFSSILNVLSLAELGMGSAMVYTMYKPIAINDNDLICGLLALYKKVYRYIGLFILAIGICVVPFLQRLINGNTREINIYFLYFIFLIDTVISYWLYAYKSSILMAYQRMDMISNIRTISQLLLNGIQIIILLIFKNYYYFIIFKPLFTITNNLITNYVVSREFPELNPKGTISEELKHDIFSKVSALMGHRVGSTVISSADSLVISYFLGLDVLSIYSNYYYIIYFLISITSILFNGMLAGIGNSLVLETEKKNYALFKNINFVNVWIVTWCTTCLLCLMQPFMKIWMGESMLLPIGTLIWIVVYYYTWQFRVTGLFFKDASGMWKEDVLKPYVAVVADIILNIILIKAIGLNGVFISTVFCMIVIYFPWETNVLFKKLFKTSAKEYVLKHITFALEAIGIVVLTYNACTRIQLTEISGLFCKSIICIFLPNILFVLLNHKSEEFKFLLNKIKYIHGNIHKAG